MSKWLFVWNIILSIFLFFTLWFAISAARRADITQINLLKLSNDVSELNVAYNNLAFQILKSR